MANINLPEALQQELAQLKTTAQSVFDIQDWMMDHAVVLGLIAPERLEHLRIEVELLSTDHNDLVFEDARVAEVEVRITHEPVAASLFEKAFSLSGDSISNKAITANYDMSLTYQDWPFLTAQFVRIYLFYPDYFGAKDSTLHVLADKKLQDLLALHFPHLQLETLMQMRAADLLPETYREFNQTLFEMNARKANPNPTSPSLDGMEF